MSPTTIQIKHCNHLSKRMTQLNETPTGFHDMLHPSEFFAERTARMKVRERFDGVSSTAKEFEETQCDGVPEGKHCCRCIRRNNVKRTSFSHLSDRQNGVRVSRETRPFVASDKQEFGSTKWIVDIFVVG